MKTTRQQDNRNNEVNEKMVVRGEGMEDDG
jgi:hypothetical protein